MTLVPGNPVRLKLGMLVPGHVDPSPAGAPAEARCQFERHGHFATARVDHRGASLAFNCIAAFMDGWARSTPQAANRPRETRAAPAARDSTQNDQVN